MSKHHVVGDSPFLKRVLIPFWIIRVLIMLIEMAIYVFAIVVIAAYKSDVEKYLQDNYGTAQTVNAVLAIFVVVLIIIGFCLILDIVCIIKRARRTLSPRFFLIANVIQTTIWTVLFVLTMIGGKTVILVVINVIIM